MDERITKITSELIKSYKIVFSLCENYIEVKHKLPSLGHRIRHNGTSYSVGMIIDLSRTKRFLGHKTFGFDEFMNDVTNFTPFLLLVLSPNCKIKDDGSESNEYNIGEIIHSKIREIIRNDFPRLDEYFNLDTNKEVRDFTFENKRPPRMIKKAFNIDDRIENLYWKYNRRKHFCLKNNDTRDIEAELIVLKKLKLQAR